MATVRMSRVLRTISLILIIVVWPFTPARAQPPAEWQGPVGWWTFDDGSGTFARDSSGNGVYGMLFGELTWDTEAGHGGILLFDGTEAVPEYVLMDGSYQLPVYMITVWFRVDGSTGDHRDVLSAYAPGVQHGILLEVRRDGVVRYLHRYPLGTGGGTNIYTDSRYDDGQWYHAAMVKSADKVTLYINGVPVGSAADTSGFNPSDTLVVTLGILDHERAPDRVFLGAMDDVRIYNRPMSQEEIQAIMEAEPWAYAHNPNPADDTICTNTWVNLSWTAGELSALHQVYFGTDLNAVAQRKSSALVATTDVPSTTVGLPGSGFPSALRMGTTYYWCVDEVNDVEPDSPWYGDVWSFRVPDEPAVYLLITNERLAPAFEPLVQRRSEQGFDGRLLTVETICASYSGKDEPEQIRNCIMDHYARYGTEYVALAGDQAVVPVRWCLPRSDGYYMPADLYYADMDGSDWDVNCNGIYGEVGEVNEIELTPEVHLGRIPLRTPEDATAYINKVVTYETASPDGFANSMILFGYWGFVSGNGRRSDLRHHDPVDGAERWQMEYTYYHYIQPYWQAVPLHFLWHGYSSWDTEVCGDYDLALDHLIEQLNRGYHFAFYWGHGNAWDWAIVHAPRFNGSHAAALTNAIPNIVTAWSCGTALFDGDGTCIGEEFLQNPHGGAVAYLGYTRSSNRYQQCVAFFQSLFRIRPVTIGEAMTLCKDARAPNEVGDPYHHYAFVLLGDPCLQLLWEESGRRLQLFQPKGCEVIERGTNFYIRWNAAGMGFNSGEKVKLEYSNDSGNTWYPITGAQSLTYNGRAFCWRNCPLRAGSHYRVRVVSLSDPSVNDMSGRDFTIGDLALLTVQSTPIKAVAIDLSGSKTVHCTLNTDFDITILNGVAVSLSAPAVAGESSEYSFAQWVDEMGKQLTDAQTYTFILTQNRTVVAEYR